MVPLLLLSVTVTIAETASRWIVQCTAETNLLLESTYVQSVQTQCYRVVIRGGCANIPGARPSVVRSEDRSRAPGSGHGWMGTSEPHTAGVLAVLSMSGCREGAHEFPCACAFVLRQKQPTNEIAAMDDEASQPHSPCPLV